METSMQVDAGVQFHQGERIKSYEREGLND